MSVPAHLNGLLDLVVEAVVRELAEDADTKTPDRTQLRSGVDFSTADDHHHEHAQYCTAAAPAATRT